MPSIKKKTKALAIELNKYDLNQPHSLLNILKNTSQNSYVNPHYIEYTLTELSQKISLINLPLDDTHNARQAQTFLILDKLKKLFCSTLRKEYGWIVKNNHNSSVWYVDDTSALRFENSAECHNYLYQHTGAFLFSVDNKTHYVLWDKKTEQLKYLKNDNDLFNYARSLDRDESVQKSQEIKQEFTFSAWISSAHICDWLDMGYKLLQVSNQIASPLLILFLQIQSAMARMQTKNSMYNDFSYDQNGFKQCPTTVNCNNDLNFNGIQIIGARQMENLLHVKFVGDVNGDHIDDLLAAGTYFPSHPNPNMRTYGSTYIVFGTTTGFPRRLELAKLDGRNGFCIFPFSAQYTLYAANLIGDINNDGIQDIAIGPSDYFPLEGFVVFGRKNDFHFPAVLDVMQNSNGETGFRFRLQGRMSSSTVSSAGDINGDGLNDMLVGAPYQGLGCVIFGRKKNEKFPPIFDYTNFDGRNGFCVYTPMPYPGSYFGFPVATVGDINNDHLPDIIIGSVRHPSNPSYQNSVHALFGRNYTTMPAFPLEWSIMTLNGTNGFRLMCELRYSLSGAGDINNDGIKDILIGGVGGKSYVVFGQKTPFLPEIAIDQMLDGKRGFLMRAVGNVIDYSVSYAGDINQDGIDDVILGSPNTREAFVVFGNSTGFNATIQLNKLNGDDGFKLYSELATFGHSVSGGGDINSDGVPDLAAAASVIDRYARPGVGQIFVAFGCTPKSNSWLSSIEVLALNSSRLVKMVAYEDNEFYYSYGQLLQKQPNGQLLESYTFFNISQPRKERTQAFIPRLTALNSTDFLLQLDFMSTLEGEAGTTNITTYLVSGRETLLSREVRRIRLIRNDYYSHGLWSFNTTQQGSKFVSIGITNKAPLKLLFSTGSFSTNSPIMRDLFRPVSDYPTQYIALDDDQHLLFFYDGSRSSVWAHLVHLKRKPRANEFQISDPDTTEVSPYFFVIPLGNYEFAYLGFRNVTHGPLEYQRFRYSSQGVLIPVPENQSPKQLLTIIAPHNQIRVIAFPDFSFVVVYLDNDKVLVKQFKSTGDELGKLTPLMTIPNKLWIQTLFSSVVDHRDYIVGLHWIKNSIHETPMQVFTRDTLWLIDDRRTNFSGYAKQWTNITLAPRFYTTLSTLGQKLSCYFQLLSNRSRVEVKTDSANCGLQLFSYLPDIIEFNVTANDSLMKMSDVFSVNITQAPLRPNPAQPVQPADWPWIVLRIVALLGGIGLDTTLFYLFLRKYRAESYKNEVENKAEVQLLLNNANEAGEQIALTIGETPVLFLRPTLAGTGVGGFVGLVLGSFSTVIHLGINSSFLWPLLDPVIGLSWGLGGGSTVGFVGYSFWARKNGITTVQGADVHAEPNGTETQEKVVQDLQSSN